jgi:hypothetical protein
MCLQTLLQHAALPVKKRKATAPTKGSKERRLESKFDHDHGKLLAMRKTD